MDNDTINETVDEAVDETAGRFSTEAEQGKEKKNRNILIPFLFLIIGALIATGGFMLYNHFGTKEVPDAEAAPTKEISILESNRDDVAVTTEKVSGGSEMSPADVYEQYVDSTVGITGNVEVNYWGYRTTSPVSGSGFIISSDGYVVTNFHVIEDVSEITVTDYNGNAYDAEVVGYDESNDIAVLKIEAEGLNQVVVGDSDKLRVGDTVIAIGNPLGELTFSLTAGIVSALDREVTLSSNQKMNLIQTDCAINSGNSGGALFNLYGEVVGITNAKYSSSSSGASIDNIGFAIPINSVNEIVASIIEKGYISKPYIGISVSSVSDGYRQYGAAVRSVTEDGPAAAAGVQENDIIIAVDGKDVVSSDELVSIVTGHNPGDELKLTIVRNYETIEITVVVGETQQAALPVQTEPSQTEGEFDEEESFDPEDWIGSFWPFGYGG